MSWWCMNLLRPDSRIAARCNRLHKAGLSTVLECGLDEARYETFPSFFAFSAITCTNASYSFSY